MAMMPNVDDIAQCQTQIAHGLVGEVVKELKFSGLQWLSRNSQSWRIEVWF
jgi:hypothetical protein